MKGYTFGLLGILLPGFIYAWTAPTAAPPGNNVSAPVNIGVADQFKSGVLGANLVNIVGSSQYLNFGNTTGASGFGIRNNGGVVEYKQSTGSASSYNWQELGKGRGSYVSIALNHCGGACGSYHAINSWINVSGYGYTWATTLNTDTVMFTPNGTGTITINRAGVYRIRMRNMMIPTTNRSLLSYLCPVINGSTSCVENSTHGLNHELKTAGMWHQEDKEFVAELSAGTTVGYAYYIYDGMSYWAHDWYTNMSVTRL